MRFLCDEQYFQVRREIRAWHAGNRHRRYPEYYPGSHFIFGLGLGTAGAAIATALSQTVSFIILLVLFLKGKSDVRLRITKVSKQLKTYVDIVTTGMPTLCRQGLASLASVALNVNAAMYGDAAVAAMSIVGRLMFSCFPPCLALGRASSLWQASIMGQKNMTECMKPPVLQSWWVRW